MRRCPGFAAGSGNGCTCNLREVSVAAVAECAALRSWPSFCCSACMTPHTRAARTHVLCRFHTPKFSQTRSAAGCRAAGTRSLCALAGHVGAATRRRGRGACEGALAAGGRAGRAGVKDPAGGIAAVAFAVWVPVKPVGRVDRFVVRRPGGGITLHDVGECCLKACFGVAASCDGNAPHWR